MAAWTIISCHPEQQPQELDDGETTSVIEMNFLNRSFSPLACILQARQHQDKKDYKIAEKFPQNAYKVFNNN
jgi:hypothetical protein